MYLKMDKNGEIFQTDALQGNEKGVGRKAVLVQDSDVHNFSTLQDPKVMRDRKALHNLKKLNHQNQINKLKEDKNKQALIERARRHQMEKEFWLKKKVHALQENMKNMRKIAGIKQGYQNFEKMSGVSGFGLTTDGRKPYADMPSLDWTPIEQVDEAFGKYPDGGMGALPEGYVSTQPTGKIQQLSEFDMQRLNSSLPEDEVATSAPTMLTNSNIKGKFSSFHKDIIDKFFSGKFKFSYSTGTNATTLYYMNIDMPLRNRVQDHNRQYNPAAEIKASGSRGWAWSGWYENGAWVSVKIPFIHGLPIDTPSNANKMLQTSWRKNKFFGYYKPIIEAFALKKKLADEQNAAEKQRLLEQARIAGEQSAQSKSFTTTEKIQEIVTDAFTNAAEGQLMNVKKDLAEPKIMSHAHPMLRQGLLK